MSSLLLDANFEQKIMEQALLLFQQNVFGKIQNCANTAPSTNKAYSSK